jgi:hypothetical protein
MSVLFLVPQEMNVLERLVSHCSEVLGVPELHITFAINRSSADHSPIPGECSICTPDFTHGAVAVNKNFVKSNLSMKSESATGDRAGDSQSAPYCILLLAAHTRRIIRGEKTAD